MKLTQGDIWFTRFSSPTGREQGFDRPSLIVSNDKLNQSRLGLVFAVPLTTRERGYLTHVRIGRDGTGLAKTSWAMIEQIRAISPDRFDFFVGTAPEEVVEEAVTVLKRML
ncbi:type II toxin-antitoxin system PemK/MazF family toxin [Nonomuraea sp. KC401]|uniref:type II toxin-antitoxin system PemK/MazF family toxin n=1 Tax=unclassified Nonomuraea TaxID=2593643 RepID=UPI0010FE336A|nr:MULTISPECIES: type II toxin-antitoxin system PemK/MazF family toxin [unclassified Nonomuraea]NBE93677.1 type II toxin-antitoxin system PemK/MazF family toxin [Nonomuraea sp. K271]TLF59303.1 type II toxin-antitoxin system PemK/MazF family toxin [Nonomuraea sp. KC401]